MQSEGDLLVNSDYARAECAERDRALKLYLRARDYGLRGLEVRYRGITEQLAADPAAAAAAHPGQRDVPILYWTAAAWGSAIALGKDRPELLADLPAIRALDRARRCSSTRRYEGGALHEAAIVLDALPEAMGGSTQRARGTSSARSSCRTTSAPDPT